MSVIEINDENFDEVIKKSDKVVVVDFWAEWCGPCRMIAPIIEELAEEYAGKVVFGKVNVDENPEIAAKYGIMSIPTLLFFKNGKVVDQLVGARPKEALKERIKKYL
uniref:AECA THIOREDOXIN n=1 Tax=synthetic construct TaxID=32630 RepID=UPI00038A5F63|nr:Chain A, AECA THIOREDOXIN [synthetic construct]3ZIV_B Chain B, AECA THIOREDOXIN [synthetic construct]3ZIV_C Chain C, AECA THIOREDOXIN [synthetic construct]